MCDAWTANEREKYVIFDFAIVRSVCKFCKMKNKKSIDDLPFLWRLIYIDIWIWMGAVWTWRRMQKNWDILFFSIAGFEDNLEWFFFWSVNVWASRDNAYTYRQVQITRYVYIYIVMVVCAHSLICRSHFTNYIATRSIVTVCWSHRYLHTCGMPIHWLSVSGLH